MIRREFLSNTSKAIALGSVMPGFSFSAISEQSALGALLKSGMDSTDNVLVIIQLSGGNDGLNTLIPLDQYDNLVKARPNLMIPSNKVLALKGSTKTGLHPAMSGVMSLYNDGLANFVQGVGYPDQNFSHFRSTDIWLSGSDAHTVEHTGWMGRYLDHVFPNYPDDYPSATMPDPLAIQIGSLVSPGFLGPNIPMAVAIASDKNFYQLLTGDYPKANDTNPVGLEINYIRDMINKADAYNKVIKAAAEKVPSQATYPSNNGVADQLKIVARLIKGGLKTKIYMVSQSGYDTHAGQVDPTDKTKGDHATLLGTLSDAIFAFQNDLKLLGVDDRVLGMTFSEFGRRINSNGSQGTDHGSSLPMLFFGTRVQNGIIGTNPAIPASLRSSDNLPMQYDFKSVYASVLEQWFCLDKTALQNILLKDYQSLPIIQKSACAGGGASSIADHQASLDQKRLSCYPNPWTDKLELEAYALGGHCLLQIFNTEGRMIAELVNQDLNKGYHHFTLSDSELPNGFYHCRFQNENYQQVVVVQKVR